MLSANANVSQSNCGSARRSISNDRSCTGLRSAGVVPLSNLGAGGSTFTHINPNTDTNKHTHVHEHPRARRRLTVNLPTADKQTRTPQLLAKGLCQGQICERRLLAQSCPVRRFMHTCVGDGANWISATPCAYIEICRAADHNHQSAETSKSETKHNGTGTTRRACEARCLCAGTGGGTGSRCRMVMDTPTLLSTRCWCTARRAI
jgi:hypothetical protein